jgi:PTH1 family peptidyl-tRNA hydrolase
MTAQLIRLIVGLGNPGEKYTQTRHNAGFWFVETLANTFQGQFRPEPKFSADVARISILGQDLWLLKPVTFMNRSGLAVRQIADFYKIPIDETLVAHDEIDLPPGTVRLKRGGGHGGHNGLRDIVNHLGKDFWRLRIGVGHPGHKDEVVDYVLGRASKADECLIDESIEAALAGVDLIVAGEFEKAMNRLHGSSNR